jgi:polysaccharide biosynthesis protein PslH
VSAVEPGTGLAPDLGDQCWIFVEDSEFLPPHGGGEREHLAMLRAARDAGVLGAVVLPVSGPIDRESYESEFGGAPLITVDRRENPVLLLHPRRPYTVASRPPGPSLVARVRAAAPAATGIIITSYKSWAIGAVLAQGLRLPAVLRMHNREGAYHRSLALGTPGLRGLALRWEAARIERDERRLSHEPWLAGVADISAADASWRAALGPVPVRHVPPFAGPDLPPIRREPAVPPTVLFLGALDVATNVDAVRWLVKQVWPRVHAARPDATVQIVGRAPTEQVRRWVEQTTAAELHADVASIEPYLAAAGVAVNPAVSGSGVNIKLVEYLAAEVPVVTTSHATAGLGPIDGVAVADDASDFADAVLDLLDHPDEAAETARRAAASIRRQLDPTAGLASVASLLGH